MRAFICILPLVLVACITPAAADAPSDINIDNMPEVSVKGLSELAPVARIIEVDGLHGMSDNVYLVDSCHTSTEDGVDYTACCPSGWHVLAKSPNGLLCEEG